jgi:LytS/YehU family sensor histidine kinase
MSTLGRECELAGHYLALMAIRYGERLQIRIDCDEAARPGIAALAADATGGNAVQHGVEPHAGEVTSSRCRHAASRIACCCWWCATTAPASATRCWAAALACAMRQRLQAIYGDAASLRLHIGADGWTVAEPPAGSA